MRARLVRCAPGADAGPGADGARCAASADAAGGGAAGGAVRCMPGAAAGGAVRCAPGADAGPGADGARCAASADAAGGGAAGGAAAVYAGCCCGRCGARRARMVCAGSGRLKQWTVKEAMTRGALPHGGGGRRFFLPGSRRFERPSAACARRGSRVAAPAPAAAGASPRPPLAAWVRVCSGSAARKRFECPSWRGGKRRNPAEKAAAGGLFRRALCACLNKL